MSHSHSRSWVHKNRRHGTRLTAFFLALVLVVAGSTNIGVTQAAAAPASARAADSGDFALTISASQLGIDPAVMRKAVPEIQAEIIQAGGLSEAIAKQADDYPVYNTAFDPARMPDFDGTLTLTADGAGMTVTVPAPDVQATVTWWQSIGAWVAGAAVGYFLRMFCMAILTATGVGITIVPLVCTPLGGAMTGLTQSLIVNSIDHKLGTKEAWVDIILKTLAGAVAGGLWEAYLAPFAKTYLPAALTKMGQWLIDRAPGLASRFGLQTSEALEAAGERMIELEDLLAEQMSHWGVPGNNRPLKVMVVGDSISQGAEGDWTWRFRLWEWFESQRIPVNFVGPYQGTKPPAEATGPAPPRLQGEPDPGEGMPRTWGKYAAAAPAFDSDHFAVWGRQAAQVKNEIRTRVAEYQPDLLLVELGFNDMGWKADNAEGTLNSMKTLVDQARVAKPNIKIALANVPMRTALGGREDLPVMIDSYNRMLATAIPSWSTSQSRVELVGLRGTYRCWLERCPNGYDGLHPNASGEFMIAQAFRATLMQQFGIGSTVPVPGEVPQRPTPVPSNVVVEPGPQGLKVTWDAVFGAHGYTVRSRLVGSADWSESRASANRHDTLSPHGLKWEYQVRTDNGDTDDQKSAWTSPTAPVVASPTAPPGPFPIVTRATSTGFDITWGETVGAVERFGVIYWDQDDPGAFLSAVGIRGHAAHIDGLKVGHRYLVWVSSWDTSGGGGVPNPGRPVLVGGGTPAAPSGLKATALDASSVYLTWNKSTGAAGYRVWVRNPIDGSEMTASDQTIMETTWGVGFLVYGALNYEFCVTAVNGALESGMSNCVKPVGSS
ncbi:GDSL-type esterase/lipase family protein [Micromonospora zamorensis]|uniref:GDSL-type esterase/lipase family protein n=1 Tax=Micromonospora zamorensis TaxID=709883 RepID=UPI00379FC509